MKKAQIIVTILLATCHLGQPALAKTLFGGADCGQWLNDKRSTDKTWALGYISGLNTMYSATRGEDPLNKVNSAEQIYVWLDNYCKNNPLETVARGGINLFAELLKSSK